MKPLADPAIHGSRADGDHQSDDHLTYHHYAYHRDEADAVPVARRCAVDGLRVFHLMPFALHDEADFGRAYLGENDRDPNELHVEPVPERHQRRPRLHQMQALLR